MDAPPPSTPQPAGGGHRRIPSDPQPKSRSQPSRSSLWEAIAVARQVRDRRSMRSNQEEPDDAGRHDNRVEGPLLPRELQPRPGRTSCVGRAGSPVRGLPEPDTDGGNIVSTRNDKRFLPEAGDGGASITIFAESSLRSLRWSATAPAAASRVAAAPEASCTGRSTFAGAKGRSSAVATYKRVMCRGFARSLSGGAPGDSRNASTGSWPRRACGSWLGWSRSQMRAEGVDA